MADDFLPNGIFADTGMPLPGLSGCMPTLVRANALTESGAAQKRLQSTDAAPGSIFGVSLETDPSNLSESGWGVVFPSDVDSAAIEEALSPLIEHRRSQVLDFQGRIRLRGR